MIQADLKHVWLVSESSKNVVHVSLNVSGISQQHQCCCSLCCSQLFVSQILSLELIEHQVLQLVLSFWWRERKQLVLINFWRAAARKKLPTPGCLTSAVTDSSVGIWALVVLPKNNTSKRNSWKLILCFFFLSEHRLVNAHRKLYCKCRKVRNWTYFAEIPAWTPLKLTRLLSR